MTVCATKSAKAIFVTCNPSLHPNSVRHSRSSRRVLYKFTARLTRLMRATASSRTQESNHSFERIMQQTLLRGEYAGDQWAEAHGSSPLILIWNTRFALIVNSFLMRERWVRNGAKSNCIAHIIIIDRVCVDRVFTHCLIALT